MKVFRVTDDNKELKFSQNNDHVNIYFNTPLKINQEENISIKYEGSSCRRTYYRHE